MSLNNVIKFLDKVAEDHELQSTIQTIASNNDEQAVKQIIRIASDSGCDFEERELDDLCLAQAASEMQHETGKAFSPEELQSVANDGKLFQAPGDMHTIEQQFNQQYLKLQQPHQAEQQQLTALSNVMKAKHETAKNALKKIK